MEADKILNFYQQMSSVVGNLMTGSDHSERINIAKPLLIAAKDLRQGIGDLGFGFG
jgi:hypothetical protein